MSFLSANVKTVVNNLPSKTLNARSHNALSGWKNNHNIASDLYMLYITYNLIQRFNCFGGIISGIYQIKS
nr:hypothetical protein CJLB15_00021 [Campylobacter phage CJLB-15]